jgi:hypothetical protein
MLAPSGLLVDMHPSSARARLRVGTTDIGPRHQEQWVREWLRPAERALAGLAREGLFEPLADVAVDVTHRFDDAREFLEELDDWEYGWISDRVRRRVEQAAAPIEVVEHVVLRTFRAR